MCLRSTTNSGCGTGAYASLRVPYERLATAPTLAGAVLVYGPPESRQRPGLSLLRLLSQKRLLGSWKHARLPMPKLLPLLPAPAWHNPAANGGCMTQRHVVA